MSKDIMLVNRAPVLTLWAAVVAERFGFDCEEALSLGKALAGLNAQSKGRALGIFKPSPKAVREARKRERGEEFWVGLCGRAIPAKNTSKGVRAVTGGKPVEPASVQRYIEQKFGEDLDRVKESMSELAASYEPDDLAACSFSLYEEFRPQIPHGKKGWGAKGELDLGLIRSLVPNP